MATGMCPYEPDAAMKSRFIIDSTPEMSRRQEHRDQQRRADIAINVKMITKPEDVEEIKIKVLRQERYTHLCIVPSQVPSYLSLIRQYKREPVNGIQLLTKHLLFIANGSIPDLFR